MSAKSKIAAALTVLTVAAAATLPSTQAEARGGAIAAGLIGGAVLGAMIVGSQAHAAPGYYYEPAPRRCRMVAQYDRWGNYIGRTRVCYRY